MSEPMHETENLPAVVRDVKASELALTGAAGGVALTSLGGVMALAQVMARSDIGVRKHLRNNPGACTAVCLQAFEWEMSPYAVANKSYLVNDQIAYESTLLHAVILRRAPIKGRLRHEYSGEGQQRRLRVVATLRDQEGGGEVDYTSPALADIRPQNSPLWKSDPDQQLSYYSVRGLARRHFPDVIMGVQEREEAEAITLDPSQYRVTDGAQSIGDKLAALAKAHGADPETGEIQEADVTEVIQPKAAPAAPAVEEPRRRGRPPGSRNKEKAQAPEAGIPAAPAAPAAAPAVEEPKLVEAAKPAESESPEPGPNPDDPQVQYEQCLVQMNGANGVRALEDVYDMWREPSDSWPTALLQAMEDDMDRNLERFGMERGDDGQAVPRAGADKAQASAPVDDTPVGRARAAGAAAKAAGESRRAIPKELKADGRDDEMEAWWAGYDAA